MQIFISRTPDADGFIHWSIERRGEVLAAGKATTHEEAAEQAEDAADDIYFGLTAGLGTV